jgi:biopolymer transport protein TolR
MRRNNNDQPMSEINITPLTDVMLVLLIIFMISSPVLLARGMEVHLPQVTDPPMLEQQDHVLYISAEGGYQLDGKDYGGVELSDAFKELVTKTDAEGGTVNLFIKADQTVPYGDVTTVMDIATSAGIEKIGLVQEVLEGGSEPGPVTTDPSDTTTPIDVPSEENISTADGN